LGHPNKFSTGFASLQRYWHSSSRRQPNFVALKRQRHLYSAGQPPRWALAHDTTITTAIFRPFSGTTRVSWCQKETSGLYGAREGRHTDHLAGHHSIWTNLHHPPIFYRPDALPAAQLTASKHWRQPVHWPTLYFKNHPVSFWKHLEALTLQTVEDHSKY